MAEVFISYSRKDLSFGRKLHEAFENQGLDVWIDWKDIPITAEWWDEIRRGIEKSDNFIFVISPDSISSPICNLELHHAWKNNKRVIPVVYRRVSERKGLEAIRGQVFGEFVRKLIGEQDIYNLAHRNWVYLSGKNWYFFTDIENFREKTYKLIEAVRMDLEFVKMHTRLLVRALDWVENGRENSYVIRGKDLDSAEAFLGQVDSFADPKLTPIQQEFIIFSRRYSNRQQKILIGSIVFGLAIAVALAIFAFYQFLTASSEANQRATQQAIAETEVVARTTQQAIAVEADATAIAEAAVRATAQIEAQIQRSRADEEANISFASELVSKAKLLGVDTPIDVNLSALLLIESIQRVPSVESDQSLRSILKYIPRIVSSVNIDDVVSSTFIHDGSEVVSMSTDGTISVWESSNGNVTAQMLHEGANQFAISSNGNIVASGGSDGVVRVWELNEALEITHVAHTAPIVAIVLSPDGRIVVSASEDGATYIWESSTGNIINQVMHIDVNRIAISSDGNLVASGGIDGLLRIWDIIGGNEIAQMSHDDSIMAIVFFPDGSKIVTGSKDKTARVWETRTGVEIHHLVHNNTVGRLSVSSSGLWIVTGEICIGLSASGEINGCDQAGIRVWNSYSGTEVAREVHDETIASLIIGRGENLIISGEGCVASIPCRTAISAWTLNGHGQAEEEIFHLLFDTPILYLDYSFAKNFIVATGSDGVVRIIKLVSGGDIFTLKSIWIVSDATFSYDDQWVAIGQECSYLTGRCPTTACVWETVSGSLVDCVDYEGWVRDVEFVRSRDWFVSGYSDGTIMVEDFNDGKLVVRMEQDASLVAMDVSPDSQLIASGGSDGKVTIWNSNNGEVLTKKQHEDSLRAVAFSPDSRLVVSASKDGAIYVWGAENGNEIAWVNHDDVRNVMFSPDGLYIISSNAYYAVIWNTNNKQEVFQTNHEGYLTYATVTPNGQWLVTLESCELGEICDSIMRIWDLKGGKEISKFVVEGKTWLLSISSNSKWIATGETCWDKIPCTAAVRVFELETGFEVSHVIHFGTITSIDFSSDNQFIVSSDTNGTVHVWPWRSEDIVFEACNALTRNLTYEEWSQYLAVEPYRPTCTNLPMPGE